MIFQMEINERAVGLIKENMKKCGIKEMREYFQNALAVLHCNIVEAERCCKIGSEDDEKEFSHIVLPILETLREVNTKERKG